MFSKLALIALASLLVPTFASPILQERADGPGTPYKCASNFNVAAVKTSLLKEGANARDIAITILETGCDMDGTHYPYGDNKKQDAANFGLFKNNWGTIRRHCSEFKGQGSNNWENGNVLNNRPVNAIKCQHQQIDALGIKGFYQAQRGVPGQGADYERAVEYILNYLNQGHLHDDMVTYYTLHAV